MLGWAQALMPEGFSLHTLVDNLASRAFYNHHGLAEGGHVINPINDITMNKAIAARAAVEGRA